MKKIIIGFAILFIVTFQSCLKDDSNVDFSNLGYVTEILYPPVAGAAGADAAGSGLAYFAKAALTYPPTDEADTSYFIVNLASPNPMAKDLPITVGIDNSKLNDNYPSDSINYEAMPDSVYKLLNTDGVIPAGKRLDTFYIVFYPSKFDPTKNYGLPITITSAEGTTISSNFGTLYYHAIGNPLAGLYNWEWIRWNAPDTTGTPTYDLDYSPALFAPDNPTQVETASGYYYQARYVITFDNNGGVLSNFAVSFNQDDIDTYYTPTGVSMNTPVFIFADGITKQFRIYSVATTSSGPRSLIDYYY